MPVTVEANIVVPMKLMEMADRSSGMLARNVTLELIAPAGGAAAAGLDATAGTKESGRTAAARAMARRLLMRQDFAVGSRAPAETIRSGRGPRGASPGPGAPRCRSADRAAPASRCLQRARR